MRKLSRVRKLRESDRQLLLDIKDTVLRFVPDAEIVLYGSVARGTATPESDYDLLILTGRRLTSDEKRQMSYAVYDLELEREVVISLAIYARDEWQSPVFRASPFRHNVTRDGILA